MHQVDHPVWFSSRLILLFVVMARISHLKNSHFLRKSTCWGKVCISIW